MNSAADGPEGTGGEGGNLFSSFCSLLPDRLNGVSPPQCGQLLSEARGQPHRTVLLSQFSAALCARSGPGHWSPSGLSRLRYGAATGDSGPRQAVQGKVSFSVS
jgi:hypothetical protein